MKKILFIIVLAICSITANAQTENTKFKEETVKLIKIISADSFMPYIEQITAAIPEENQTAFSKELEVTFDKLYSSMAEIYMKEFTEEEILQLIAFYETPVGKKIASISGTLSQEASVALQDWGLEVQEIMEKYQ